MEDFMKKIVLLTAAFVSMVSFISCSKKLPSLSGDEALNALEAAEVINMSGNTKAVSNSSDVVVGDVICGKVKERGVFDPQIAYYVDGKEQFYIKYDSFDNPELDGGTTYGYYDKDKNFYGYMQKVILDRDIGYVYVYYDSDLNMKDYYVKANEEIGDNLAREGATIYRMDGEEVGYLRTEGGKYYSVEMNFGESVSELSIMDKIATYWCNASDKNMLHGSKY